MLPKGANWSPKGAKSEPKGDQNASQNRCSEKVAKREPKGRARLGEMAPKMEPFSIKNMIKNLCTNLCQQNMKFDGKSIQK